MGSFLTSLNRLLPFATPATPLVQDLLHLGVICAVLYFAPQAQDWWQRWKRHDDPIGHEQRVVDADEQPGNGVLDADEDVRAEGVDRPLADLLPDVPQVEQHHAPGRDRDAVPAAAQEDGAAGPAAGAARAPDTASGRNVGAKKAKSLARKDHRRAYHEFQRSQGEAQRARDAEGAAERETAIAAERERRKAAEAAVEAKKARERERKREQDRKDREEEIRQRELTVSLVRDELEQCRMCDLNRVARQVGDVDQEWVERIVNASGMIGRKGDVTTMITTTGWALRVTADDMARLYETAAKTAQSFDKGQVSYDTLGGLLEELLRETR